MDELGLYAMEDGAASFTRIVTVVEALPPELLAVTVYVVAVDIAVGVPEIVPVTLLNERPAGRTSEICQRVTAPPLNTGVAGVMSESLVNDKKLGLYETEDGATSLT
tara:strand:+ start:845 stop:1165 length:321 start_codon:yes stop_codon:yes gene_type:complete